MGWRSDLRDHFVGDAAQRQGSNRNEGEGWRFAEASQGLPKVGH